MGSIEERILSRLGVPDLPEKLAALSPSDFQSLLLSLYRVRTERMTPPTLLKAAETNRFCVPGTLSPARFHRLEAQLLEFAEAMGIEGVLLSPSAPLGSCSVFGCVDQNNVISAARGTETLADPTNMLAIEIARRLKGGRSGTHAPMHLCTTARVVRAQAYPDESFLAHFGLFCQVSAGSDTGSYAAEQTLLVKQLTYYRKLLSERYHAELSVKLRRRSGYSDSEGFFQKMTELMRRELPDVPVTLDTETENNRYYLGLNFKLYLRTDGGTVEIGDGGFVDWVARMTGNKKERCLISALGLERLLLCQSDG